jgi:hypothetical protein
MMYRPVCADPPHDWEWENSRRYSEEAFTDFLEWRLLELDVSTLNEELESELRKEFMRT